MRISVRIRIRTSLADIVISAYAGMVRVVLQRCDGDPAEGHPRDQAVLPPLHLGKEEGKSVTLCHEFESLREADAFPQAPLRTDEPILFRHFDFRLEIS